MFLVYNRATVSIQVDFTDITLSEQSRELLLKIEKRFNEVRKKRPLTTDELKAVRKWFNITYTYHSNAIEGNTLTLEETRLVLEDGITVGGKPLREIFEATNHLHVLDDLYEDIHSKQPLTEKRVLFYHSRLLANIEESAGKYRNIQVFVTGSEEVLPLSEEVPPLMKKMFQWYTNSRHDPIIKGILLHWYFVKIHPFLDGNGRIARFLLNYELLRTEMFPVIIPIVRRSEYIASIKEQDKFILCMLDIIHENGKDYERMLT